MSSAQAMPNGLDCTHELLLWALDANEVCTAN
jgi:hypothetical protein